MTRLLCLLTLACSGPGMAPSDAGRDAGTAQALPVDCSVLANESSDACVSPPSRLPGSVGAGPSVAHQPGFPAINRGFVDAQGRLVVGAGYGSSVDPVGLVLAIDLDSGARTVVSGQYEDAATGRTMVGDGDVLGHVLDVHPAPGDQLAVVSDGAAGTVVHRVDPVSGDRTLVWAYGDPTYGQCQVDARQVSPSSHTLAVGDDGTIYLVLWNNPAMTGIGVVAIAADGSACRLSTLVGSLSSDVGSGVDLVSYFAILRFLGGALWGLDPLGERLVRIDPTDGARRGISSTGAPPLGDGPDLGLEMIAPTEDADVVVTAGDYGPEARAEIVLVRTDTGARTSATVLAGPAIEGIQYAWDHPTRHLYVGLVQGLAIALIDPETGNSNTISY